MREMIMSKTAPNPDRTVIVRGTFTAGLLVRGYFRRFLAQERFIRVPMRIEYEEQKGWLESDFLIAVSGPRRNVRAWFSAVENWIDSINGEDHE